MEIKAYNQWNKDSIRPGVVGSVGDTLGIIKLRTSAPDMDPRYDTIFSPTNEPLRGSNISDGYPRSFTSHGRVAKVVPKRMKINQRFQTDLGWIHEDLQPVDRSRTSIMGSTGNLNWDRQIATIYKAATTGENFLPTPGGYAPEKGKIPRGSQIPRIVAASSGTGIAEPAKDVSVTDVTFGNIGAERGKVVKTVEEKINPKWLWTPKNDDPRRKFTSDEIHTYLIRNIPGGDGYAGYDSQYDIWYWLDDNPNITQAARHAVSNDRIAVNASHTGGWHRPTGEPPTYIDIAADDEVIGPKPGDERKKVPGKPEGK